MSKNNTSIEKAIEELRKREHLLTELQALIDTIDNNMYWYSTVVRDDDGNAKYDDDDREIRVAPTEDDYYFHHYNALSDIKEHLLKLV